MAIPVTRIDTLNMMLQIQRNFTGLQSDMRNNALSWRASAQAASIPVATLAGFMNSAAGAYQTRLGWVTTAQAGPYWAAISNMYVSNLGGVGSEFVAVKTPLQAVADQLGPASKNNYTQIIAACDDIIAAINAPPSLWPA